MKIKTTTPKSKIIAIATVAGLLVAAGGIALWLQYGRQSNPSELTDKTQSVKQEQVDESKQPTGAEEDDGESNLPPKQTQTSTDTSEKPNDTTTNDTNNTIEKPTIERASQKNDSIKVVATLTKSSKGYCELLLQKTGQKTISAKSNVVLGPSYYACDFIIPTRSLPTGGNWSATVVHRLGNSTASSSQQMVSVQK